MQNNGFFSLFKKFQSMLLNKLIGPLLQSNFYAGINKSINVTVEDFPWIRNMLERFSFYISVTQELNTFTTVVSAGIPIN